MGIMKRTRLPLVGCEAAMLAKVLPGMQRAAQRVRALVGRRGATPPESAPSSRTEALPEPVAERAVRCPHCGTEMILVRVWSARGGVLFDLLANAGAPPGRGNPLPAPKAEERPPFSQLLLAFATGWEKLVFVVEPVRRRR